MVVEEDQLTFRASGIARFAAIVVGAAAALVTASAVVVQVRDPEPASWPGFLFFIVVLGLVARAARQVRVVARTDGLFIHPGWKPFTVPWHRVEGFWLSSDDRRYGGVFVLISPDQIIQLPLAQSVPPGRPNREQAERMFEGLCSYASTMRAPILSGDVEAIAKSRLPRGKPATRWPL